MSGRETGDTESTELGGEPGARRMAERTDPPGLAHEPQDIRRDIEDTRAELGETVEALAEKTDVKGRAKARVIEMRARVTTATPEEAKQALTRVARGAEQRPRPAIGVAAAAGFLLGLLIGRR